MFAPGWLLARQGQAEVSLAELRRGLDAWIELGIRVLEPCFKASLAEAQLNAGEAPRPGSRCSTTPSASRTSTGCATGVRNFYG